MSFRRSWGDSINSVGPLDSLRIGPWGRSTAICQVTRAERMTVTGYFREQKANLSRSSNWTDFIEIFTLVDELYVRAIALVPNNRPRIFGQILLVSHKSFLSAAALIGQAQPDDAAPITRRAIEAAQFAAAIRTNPAEIDAWLAFETRMQRWRDRQEGKKPKWLKPKLGDVDSGIKPTIDKLMQMHGVLSDFGHFTPEYLFELDWEKNDHNLHLNYFMREQRTLERQIILTSGTNLRILEVIDWCLDGAFKLDPDWPRLVDTLRERAAPLARKFERSKPEGAT
jgi:hypothetical protein